MSFEIRICKGSRRGVILFGLLALSTAFLDSLMLAHARSTVLAAFLAAIMLAEMSVTLSAAISSLIVLTEAKLTLDASTPVMQRAVPC